MFRRIHNHHRNHKLLIQHEKDVIIVKNSSTNNGHGVNIWKPSCLSCCHQVQLLYCISMTAVIIACISFGTSMILYRNNQQQSYMYEYHHADDASFRLQRLPQPQPSPTSISSSLQATTTGTSMTRSLSLNRMVDVDSFDNIENDDDDDEYKENSNTNATTIDKDGDDDYVDDGATISTAKLTKSMRHDADTNEGLPFDLILVDNNQYDPRLNSTTIMRVPVDRLDNASQNHENPRVFSLWQHDKHHNDRSGSRGIGTFIASYYAFTFAVSIPTTAILLATSDNNATTEPVSSNSTDPVLVLPFERPFYEQCVPMSEWQTMSFPTCNVLHEINIGGSSPSSHLDGDDIVSLLSMQGSWRSVWKYQQQQQNYPPVVLKLLQHTHREFNHESYRYHTIDALAMERLTSSPYIVSMYGFCGQSVITEMGSSTRSARMYLKEKSLSSLDRLLIAKNLVTALRHIHSIDCNKDDGPINKTNTKERNDSATISTNTERKLQNQQQCHSSLAHNDLNMANVILMNDHNSDSHTTNVAATPPIIKINDFNIAVMLRWNTTSNQPCSGIPVRFRSPMWKSPEEIQNTSYVDPVYTDTYGVGNMLYQILTTRQPWTHNEPLGPYNSSVVEQLKLNGTLPFVPTKYRPASICTTTLEDIVDEPKSNKETKRRSRTSSLPFSSDLPLIPLFYATMSCFQYKPHDRFTSTELETKLNWSYQFLVENEQRILQKLVRKNSKSTRTTSKIIRELDEMFLQLFFGKNDSKVIT